MKFPWKSIVASALAANAFAVSQEPAPSVSSPSADHADAPSAEPVELTAARAKYTAAAKDLHERVPNATTLRNTKYAGDLQTLERQIAATGNLDALLPVRTEREAIAGGNATAGFDPADSKVPAAARELRAAYAADLEKISKYAVSEERTIGSAYLRQLEELERRLTTAGKVDAALAVRTEKLQMQGLLSEPNPPAAAPSAPLATARPPAATPAPAAKTEPADNSFPATPGAIKAFFAGTRWTYPANYAKIDKSVAWIEFEPNGEVLCGWHAPGDTGKWKVEPDGTVLIAIWVKKSILEPVTLGPDKKTASYKPLHGGETKLWRVTP